MGGFSGGSLWKYRFFFNSMAFYGIAGEWVQVFVSTPGGVNERQDFLWDGNDKGCGDSQWIMTFSGFGQGLDFTSKIKSPFLFIFLSLIKAFSI